MELLSVRSMLRGPEIDTSKRDELKRLEELKLERASVSVEANPERCVYFGFKALVTRIYPSVFLY